MKKLLLVLALVLVAVSCGTRPENQMTVSGKIDGLKKGTLYLQKISDSVLTNIDSLEIRGESDFMFEWELESPELFYLYLKKADNNELNDRLAFFGEKGIITINTSWNKFATEAEIKGSQSHNDYMEYMDMMSEFNKRDLELAQSAVTETDSIKADSIENLAERNYVSRYRYLLNFGLTHPNSYATPYIIITDGQEITPKYLDSIYKVLPDSIAQSKYGKVLAKIVKGD